MRGGGGSFLIMVHTSRGQYSIDIAGSLHTNEVPDILRRYRVPPSGIFAVLIMSRAPDTDNSTSNHIEYMLFNIVYVPASNRYSVLVCVY